uniref:F-box domain-containing protein n=1 Tax=Angiostrongylus cantonensis TaxID=6313 RepID=A0A0K0CY50_ANGCA
MSDSLKNSCPSSCQYRAPTLLKCAVTASVTCNKWKSEVMVPGCFPLPDEVVLSILLFLDGEDVRSFGNTCRRFRKLIIVNKRKLRSPELQWHEAYLVFGRRISLSRFNDPLPKRTARVAASVLAGHWEFTEDEFMRDFANLFFVISPDIMYIKCKDLDDHIAEIVRRSVVNMSGKTLALEMDKCSIGENGLRCFFKYFSPFYLHIAGRFDRSMISDQVLPLSNLFSLFIGVNSSDLETRTRISGTTVRKIVNNWFRWYSDNQRKDIAQLHILLGVTVELKYAGMCQPSMVLGQHCGFNKVYVITVACSGGLDCHVLAIRVFLLISVLISLSIKLYSALLSTRIHFGIKGLPRDPSQLCDTIELQLSVLVRGHDELSQPKQLLSLFIALSACQMSVGMRIPELVLVDTLKRTRRKRNLQTPNTIQKCCTLHLSAFFCEEKILSGSIADVKRSSRIGKAYDF